MSFRLFKKSILVDLNATFYTGGFKVTATVKWKVASCYFTRFEAWVATTFPCFEKVKVLMGMKRNYKQTSREIVRTK